MIIEKICQHFIYQDDVNGEMAISCCTAMKEPHQDHEGNDKMYPCPLGFEAKQCCKVLSLGSDKVHQPTNADRIRGISDEELAKWMALLKGDTVGGSAKFILEWLQQPAKEEHRETD